MFKRISEFFQFPSFEFNWEFSFGSLPEFPGFTIIELDDFNPFEIDKINAVIAGKLKSVKAVDSCKFGILSDSTGKLYFSPEVPTAVIVEHFQGNPEAATTFQSFAEAYTTLQQLEAIQRKYDVDFELVIVAIYESDYK